MGDTPFLTTDDLRRMVDEVGGLAPAVDDGDRIERVRLFERLRAVSAAAQMCEAVEFASSQRGVQAARGVPAARRDRGVASQLALARRVSPWAAQRWLGWGRVLIDELPATFAELRAGRTSEWRAVRTLAYRLDPGGAVRRASNAANDRRVTIRPAPDVMCRFSALVPLQQGVAAYAALTRPADSLITVGANRRDQGSTSDGTLRGRDQVMADTLIERVTGQSTADDINAEITLVITDTTLFGPDTAAQQNSPDAEPGCRGDEPGLLPGYGPIPAGVARDLALGRPGHRGTRWLCRAFTSADGSRLIAMDSTRREFTEAQRAFLRLRDRTCRTPRCDAPIRLTPTTSPPTARAAPPTSTTPKASAKPATTPNKHPTGPLPPPPTAP